MPNGAKLGSESIEEVGSPISPSDSSSNISHSTTTIKESEQETHQKKRNRLTITDYIRELSQYSPSLPQIPKSQLETDNADNLETYLNAALENPEVKKNAPPQLLKNCRTSLAVRNSRKKAAAQNGRLAALEASLKALEAENLKLKIFLPMHSGDNPEQHLAATSSLSAAELDAASALMLSANTNKSETNQIKLVNAQTELAKAHDKIDQLEGVKAKLITEKFQTEATIQSLIRQLEEAKKKFETAKVTDYQRSEATVQSLKSELEEAKKKFETAKTVDKQKSEATIQSLKRQLDEAKQAIGTAKAADKQKSEAQIQSLKSKLQEAYKQIDALKIAHKKRTDELLKGWDEDVNKYNKLVQYYTDLQKEHSVLRDQVSFLSSSVPAATYLPRYSSSATPGFVKLGCDTGSKSPNVGIEGSDSAKAQQPQRPNPF